MSTRTEKLGLLKPEISDPANIEATNENWDKLDTFLSKTIGDYIVEQGFEDGYRYRKWKSGMVEVWKTSNSSEFAVLGMGITQCFFYVPEGIFEYKPNHIQVTTVSSTDKSEFGCCELVVLPSSYQKTNQITVAFVNNLDTRFSPIVNLYATYIPDA